MKQLDNPIGDSSMLLLEEDAVNPFKSTPRIKFIKYQIP